jgi:hypothetical protein
MAQLERKLRAAQGRDRDRGALCHVILIGHKLTTLSGWSFKNPHIRTLVRYVVGAGYTRPTRQQIRACGRLWLSSRTASASYRFPSTRLPALADGGDGATFTPSPALAGDAEEN